MAMGMINSNNYINIGISGSGIAGIARDLSNNVDALINPQYKFILLVWVGANDLSTRLSTFTE